MSRRRTEVAVLFSLMLSTAASSAAQSILAGVGIDHDIQRFPGNPDVNRLDGHAAGWMWLGGVTLFSHLTLRVEDSRGGRIVNSQAFTVDIDGRMPAIQSSLTHVTRSTAVLAGFTHPLFARIHLTYLAGASSTRVRRTFSTNAPLFVLVGPSASNSSVSITTDDHSALIVGADVTAELAPHLGVIAGIRRQSLHVEPDISGYGTRPLVGVIWQF